MLQDWKAATPMAVTPVEMTMLNRPEQLVNAPFNTLLMLVEMTMCPPQHALDGVVLLSQP